MNDTQQINTWIGEFGEKYTNRNAVSLKELELIYKEIYGLGRTALNKLFLNKISKNSRVLEVGCNIGNQLLYLQKMGFNKLYGIDPMDYAIKLSKKRTKKMNIIKGNVFSIPFKDEFFDLLFTSDVLIHISPKDIKRAISEIYRCTKKYIWGFEYYSSRYQSVKYHGEDNLLWKANFPKLFTDLFPKLSVVKIKYVKYLRENNKDVMYLLQKK